jgi:hypothetical protein
MRQKLDAMGADVARGLLAWNGEGNSGRFAQVLARRISISTTAIGIAAMWRFGPPASGLAGGVRQPAGRLPVP